MKYTVTFIFNPSFDKVLMIHKNRGPFPNTLNGIGGKVEEYDDSPYECAIREIEEESGIYGHEMYDLQQLVKLSFPDGVELFVFYTSTYSQTKFIQMEDEKLYWIRTEKLLDVKDPNIAGDGNTAYFINLALKHNGENGISKYYTI